MLTTEPKRLASESMARTLLLAVQEHNDTLRELETAREDRRVVEEELEAIAEALGVKPEDEGPSLSARVRAIREKTCEGSAFAHAVERWQRLQTLANKLTAFAASLEASGQSENAASLRAIAEEARKQ